MSTYNDANDPIVEIFNTNPNTSANAGGVATETGHEDANNNDIQIINRDTSNSPSLKDGGPNNFSEPFDANFINSNLSTPSLHQNQLYNTYYDNSNFPINNPTMANIPQTPNKDDFAFTPNLSQFNDLMNVPTASNGGPSNNSIPQKNDLVSSQLTTLYHNNNKNKNSLPPLQPLSESVLPTSLNFQQLTLPAATKPIAEILDNSDLHGEDKKSGSKKKKESSTPKTRPVFVMKIWSMVNDPNNHDYIRWNDDGKTFQVFHREEFMKNILPRYFKHNNFASFVRQLNMYGWHKVQDISNGTLSKDDENNGEEVLQFENPNFQRDREDLLNNIIRNKSTNQFEGNDLNNYNLQLILSELEQIKMNQLAIGEDLRRVRKDNTTLWNENYLTREKYQLQAQTLEKILKFLATVYGNSGKILEVENFPFEADANNQVAQYINQNSNPKHNVAANNYGNDFPVNPIRKPRLMLTNTGHQKSSSSDFSTPDSNKSGSIEEIMRSYDDQKSTLGNLDTSASNNVNKMYQQLLNQDSVPSPRHFFPELNASNVNSPRITAASPAGLNDQNSKLHTADDLDTITGLEQNIIKQGQSIQQVQDWIQKLATQQQLQEKQLSDAKDGTSSTNPGDLDDFDVDEFLHNNNSNNTNNSTSSGANTTEPVIITPGLGNPSPAQYPSRKRFIEEIHDNEPDSRSRKQAKSS